MSESLVEYSIFPLLRRYFYDLSSFSFWAQRRVIPEITEFVNNNGAASTAVDFGCAEKPLEYLFAQFRGKYLGVDVYPGKKVDVVYDGKRIPLETSSVDFIFSLSVFEHVEDIDSVLSELNRILKPHGTLVASVPFMWHIHGTPHDFRRPTRFGWRSLLEKTFPTAQVEVSPLDGRLNCLIHSITSQIDLIGIDLLRWGAMKFLRYSPAQQAIESGGASPESKKSRGLGLAYNLLKLNPINFALGGLSFLLSLIPISRRIEGEITSGYFIKITKKT